MQIRLVAIEQDCASTTAQPHGRDSPPLFSLSISVIELDESKNLEEDLPKLKSSGDDNVSIQYNNLLSS